MSKDQSNIVEQEAFDKAKWHFRGDFPKELPDYQAYVHTGFYIGWLILTNLVSKEFIEENSEAIAKFANRSISAVQLYQDQMDGVFISDDLNEVGFKFTKVYFDFEGGEYLNDYEHTLAENLQTPYHVEDTWSNFDKICMVLDRRYSDFKANQ